MAQPAVFVWQWGRRGAGPRFAAELAAALAAAGARPILSLSRAAESFEGLAGLCPDGHHVAGGSGLAGLALQAGRLPVTLARLSGRLAAARPAAAICAMPGYLDPFVAARLAALRIPLVTVVHDVRPHRGDRHHAVYRLQRRVVAHSRAVVTLSRFMADALAAAGPPGPAGGTVVPLFHPPFAFADLDLPPPAAPPAARDGPLRVLVTGRIRGYKGVETALDAAAALAGRSLALRIAGAADDPPWLARARAMDDVALRLEWLDERALVAEIDAADLVLFPYSEATQSGLVPLCQARGRAVVATPVGGIAEQVEHGVDGMLAARADAAALAALLARFTDEPALAGRVGAAALARHRPQPAWARFVDGLMPLLG